MEATGAGFKVMVWVAVVVFKQASLTVHNLKMVPVWVADPALVSSTNVTTKSLGIVQLSAKFVGTPVTPVPAL